MTKQQLASTYIINYVKPLVADGKIEYSDIKPDLFAQMIELLHEGKIDARRMRKWINERVGERKLDQDLISKGYKRESLDLLGQLEIDALKQ